MIKLEDRAKTIWGTDPRDYINDGWGFSSEQVRRNKAAAQRQQPQIDTSNAIGSLAEALGPTPAEREARQQRMERNRQQMQMWGGLFNGLRQLGNLYYTARGARPQRMEDPSGFINQEADRRQRLQDDMDNYRQRYAMQLYNLQRQADQDKMRQESHKAQMEWYKAREDETRNKTEREQQKAKYMENYYNAYAGKREQEAEYWRLKAQGVPDETAAKVSNYYAQAEKNRKQGEAAVTRANNTGKGSKGSSGKRGSLLPGQEGNNTQQRGSLLPK